MDVIGQCQIDRQHLEVICLEVSNGFLVVIHVLPASISCLIASSIGNDANLLIPSVEESMLLGKLNDVLVPERCLCPLPGNNHGVFF